MKANGKAYHSVNVCVCVNYTQNRSAVFYKNSWNKQFLSILCEGYVITFQQQITAEMINLVYSYTTTVILPLSFTSLSSFTLIQNINITGMLNETLS